MKQLRHIEVIFALGYLASEVAGAGFKSGQSGCRVQSLKQSTHSSHRGEWLR